MQQLRETIEVISARSCAGEVLDSVPPVVWRIRQHIRDFRKGLSIPQFRALALIQRQPSASLSILADHLGSSLPTASRLVQGLVEQGLLKRQGCPQDRRQLCLGITERGHSVLTSAWSGTQDRLTVEFQKLLPEQRTAVVEGVRLLKELFGSLGLSDIAINKPDPSERPDAMES
jgi:DNA-binding MarR family transcriptional regulator